MTEYLYILADMGFIIYAL